MYDENADRRTTVARATRDVTRARRATGDRGVARDDRVEGFCLDRSRATDMDARACASCLEAIARHRPDMKIFVESEVEIDYDAVLGEGGFCTAYVARFRGETVCARVVDGSKESQVVAEVATVGDLPRVAVKTHGCAPTTRRDGKKYLAVLSELCPDGCLEDFMTREKAAGRELSARVKLDVFLQVAEGLEELKAARVVWRDLKAKNVLVRSVVRNAFGTVTKVTIGFTDWGTAVRLPKVGKRRMTLQGPGTCGYIAPETRGPHYDFQADMWAFLVWAASMCLDVEILVDCQLEEALGELKLEKKIAATAGQETRVKEVLSKFDARVTPGCEALYDFLKSTTWVDANERWSSDEAIEEMVDFREANDLHLPMGGCTPARPTSFPEESVQCTELDETNEDEGEEIEQGSPARPQPLTPGPFRMTSVTPGPGYGMTPYAPTPFAMTPAIDSCTPGPRWHPLMNRRLVELPPPMHLHHAHETEEDVEEVATTEANAPVDENHIAVETPRAPLSVVDLNTSPHEAQAQPQKKRRGRPPKVNDCPPPVKKSKVANEDNSLALALVPTKGCSKCRWSRNGCGGCDPDTVRLPRGPAAAALKKKAATKLQKQPKRLTAKKASSKNSKALVLVGGPKGCSKCRWSAGGCGRCDPGKERLPRGPAARMAKAPTKTKKPVAKASSKAGSSMALVVYGSNTKGCSKCRWAANGCGACDPESPRLPRGPRGGKKSVPVKKTTKMKAPKRVETKSAKGMNVAFPGTKSSRYIDVNTGKPIVVKELTVVPVLRPDGKRGRGRPRILRPPRTELGCTKCRYAKKGCGKCRTELEEAKALALVR